MLNKDSFIKFMHMAASVRQIRAVYKSLHSRAPAISKKPRLFMKKNICLPKNTEMQKDIWMQIQRWLKYSTTYISSSEFSSAALTLTVGSLFRCSKGFIWTNKAEDILRNRHLSFFRLNCIVVILLASWQCLFYLFLKSLGFSEFVFVV